MDHIDWTTITLRAGAHASRDKGVCLLEAVAYWAEKPHSDHPEGVSPVLAAFGRAWNDGMRSDEEREQLKQYIPMLVGTAGNPEAEEERSWMAFDWLIRVHTVAWLNLAGGECAVHAAKLATLPVITQLTLTAEVRAALEAADGAARGAALNAADEAALEVALEAADGAAREAARGAALNAAYRAARAATYEATRAAALEAAYGAAYGAALAAARAAALEAAYGAAYGAALAAARAAALGKLQPTVIELQASAHDLYRRMIAVGAKVEA